MPGLNTRQTGMETIVPDLAHRLKRVRSGLAIGFPDDAAVDALRALRGGVWMRTEASAEQPFEDSQFEVVVVSTDAVSRETVREANRVLVQGGLMFFTVNEKHGSQAGYTAPEVYRLVREGFDILSVRRPKWWHFGVRGHTLTVCARKKAWREHRGFGSAKAFLFTPMRSRVNHGIPSDLSI